LRTGDTVTGNGGEEEGTNILSLVMSPREQELTILILCRDPVMAMHMLQLVPYPKACMGLETVHASCQEYYYERYVVLLSPDKHILVRPHVLIFHSGNMVTICSDFNVLLVLFSPFSLSLAVYGLFSLTNCQVLIY
jgi:hypothetical protein